MKTPVLFLVFNRLNMTKKVLEKIKEVKPDRFYIAADGPRDSRPDDNQKVNEVREYVMETIDWDCNVQTLFREKNLGCGKAVSGAINWFFKHETEGIILEDDCIPDVTFFSFCQELLKKYEADCRISHIGGANFQNSIMRGQNSYYFSKLFHVWGWATWKRAWTSYDFDMSLFPNFDKNNEAKNIFSDTEFQVYWNEIYRKVYQKKIDTWDYQWVFANHVNNRLSIIPNNNLITNIGVDSDSTHMHKSDKRAHLKVSPIEKITHPKIILPCADADIHTLRTETGTGFFRKLKKLIRM